MHKSITPRKAAAMVRMFQHQHEDLMTIGMGAGEFVSSFQNETLRKMGLHPGELEAKATQYYERKIAKRLRFKDKAMLFYKAQSSVRRAVANGYGYPF
jgi:hypothetical protein